MMTTTTALTVDQFRDAVAAAVRAPSTYNIQPWRFTLRGGAIEIRIDGHRLLPVADPHRWAARIACGAAITDIQLALAVAGIGTEVGLAGLSDDDLLVATITAVGPYTPSPRERGLYAAIPLRHSNRRPFFDAAVPAAARARLQTAAEQAGARLTLTDDRQTVANIADIIRDADQRLHTNPAYDAEQRTWMGHHLDSAGIPPHAAGVEPAGHDLLTMRDYGGPARAPGRDFESDPLVGVLSHRASTRPDDVRAGMALQIVLLTATDERLATSMLSQPIEIAELRDELRRVTGQHNRPHMVIRIGYGQPTRASARRRIDDVIDNTG
jgi:hypothetical protein